MVVFKQNRYMNKLLSNYYTGEVQLEFSRSGHQKSVYKGYQVKIRPSRNKTWITLIFKQNRIPSHNGKIVWNCIVRLLFEENANI